MQHQDDMEPVIAPEIIESLAREPVVPGAVEARVIEKLLGRGVLVSSLNHVHTMSRATNGRRSLFSRVIYWAALPAAASLAFAFGVHTGSAQSAPSGAATEREESAAARVSRTALKYIEALETVRGSDSSDVQLAILTLHAAADRVTLLAPESEVAQAMLMVSRGFFRSGPLQTTADATPTRLIWY